jgi:lytic cellulose monooxygenase (C1-hydroxylating)
MVKFALAALLLPSLAAAHGFLKNVQAGGQLYPAWQVFSDDILNPLPVRYARRIKENGPAAPFTGSNIT